MKFRQIITRQKHPIRKILIWILMVVVILIAGISFYSYRNFNQLLADALLKSFNSTAVSDVYELRFKKLRVNIFQGNIAVMNVVIQQRTKPLHNYPYINSSFRLTTGEIHLKEVELLTLFKSSKLRLVKIEIVKPAIQVVLNGERNIMLPFKDSTVVAGSEIENLKRFIDSYFLEEFKLVDASFHIADSWNQREFKVDKLNMSLIDLMVRQQPGKDLLSFKQVSLGVGTISGKLKKESIREIHLKDYSMDMESLNIQKTLDTLEYHFNNFNTSMKDVDILTADSVFQIGVRSIDLSYKEKSVNLLNLSFKPNLNRASIQKRHEYQTPQFSGTIGTMKLLNIDFDTLIYKHKMGIDLITLDKVDASVFKDKTKTLDNNYFPAYPGQLISGIPIPLMIKLIKAENVNIVSTERKPDGNIAMVKIQRGTLHAENFTNLPTAKTLTLNADATIENKAHFSLSLGFDYLNPKFSFSGKVGNFNMPDLNTFIQSYIPVKIKAGKSDGITFSGNAYKKNSEGEMKFLFHDLNIDLEVSSKSKWQNSIITFAANTVLINSNPAAVGQPPRVVNFRADRDMNKGFINIILKSFFSGMKETMILSDANRKAFKATKKKWNLQK